jgi:hypothetical protein
MIQRIQSLWLLAAALCAALTFKYPFYTGNKQTGENVTELNQLLASSNFFLLILSAVLTAGCVVLIFLYKNRKRQLWLTLTAFVISVINLIIYFSQIKKFVTGTFALSAVFVLLLPLLLALAARGIWKDEQLVKSLDRLR